MDDEEVDIAQAEAQRINDEGLDLALAAGLPAEPLRWRRRSRCGSTIIDAADELDADLIVTGTRATTGFRSLIQSSVADHVLRRGHRPVMIVPPGALTPRASLRPMDRFLVPAAASIVVGLLLGAAAVFGVTLMVQQDTKPALQAGDPASSVLNRVEYGDRS